MLHAMDLPTARARIEEATARMNQVYGRPLFDEWAILSLSAKGCLSAYGGPRAEAFRKALPDDVGPLFVATKGKEIHEGDLEFAEHAEGTAYDVLMKIGPVSYLVLNHTGETLANLPTALAMA